MNLAIVPAGTPSAVSPNANRRQHTSEQDAIRLQVREEIGPDPILHQHDLMVKRKYGILDPLFTGVEWQVIRRAA